MNKLSTCELFKIVDDSFKGTIVSTLKNISDNLDKYIVDPIYYDFTVKSMRSYKYPLSKLIVKSALDGTIKPLLLVEPIVESNDPIFLPSAIPTMSSVNGGIGYVDISPRAKYVRNNLRKVDSLKINEIDLYAFLQMAYLDSQLKKHASVIDKSGVIVKNVAMCYSRLFSKCIDRSFPISANPDRFNVSLYLSAVYCLVSFFGYTITDASNIIFSSGISNRNEIESDCRLLLENKLQFTNLSEFIKLYNYEFDQYIKEDSLSIRLLVNMFQKMYGANSWFALEHSITFFLMILSVPIGFYNDKIISKTIKAQVDRINNALLVTFSNSN